MLFEALTAVGDSDEAKELIEELYRTAPRIAAVSSAYARLLSLKHETEKALAIALAGLSQEPDQTGVRALLAFLVGTPASHKSAPMPGAGAIDFVASKAFTINFAAGGNSVAHRVSG
jgi:predicted Zn-dependent protease